jgi:hypothetical protein
MCLGLINWLEASSTSFTTYSRGHSSLCLSDTQTRVPTDDLTPRSTKFNGIRVPHTYQISDDVRTPYGSIRRVEEELAGLKNYVDCELKRLHKGVPRRREGAKGSARVGGLWR